MTILKKRPRDFIQAAKLVVDIAHDKIAAVKREAEEEWDKNSRRQSAG
jgi:hypothetical protein